MAALSLIEPGRARLSSFSFISARNKPDHAKETRHWLRCRAADGPTENMNSPAALFAIATFIWGSTWLVITFQLGVVEPEVSVVYRFALAAAILFVWCGARGQRLAFAPLTHAWLAAQGATLFGLNYVGVYLAERYVASGLVAVAFSTLVFVVPIGARLAFGTPVLARVAVGALVGVAGIASLFLPELRAAAAGGSAALGIAFALGSTVIAAIGNLVTVRLQRDKVPAISGTAWAMGYGALTAAAIAWARGSAWTFDWGFAYVVSLRVPGGVWQHHCVRYLLQADRKGGRQPGQLHGRRDPRRGHGTEHGLRRLSLDDHRCDRGRARICRELPGAHRQAQGLTRARVDPGALSLTFRAAQVDVRPRPNLARAIEVSVGPSAVDGHRRILN